MRKLVHEGAPEGDWQILTILGAMSSRGMIAAMTIEAATDGEIFLAFLDEVLCPALHPGDVVGMDNHSSQQGRRDMPAHRELSGRVALSAPLFSRFETDLKSSVQTKADSPSSKGANRRRPGSDHYHRTPEISPANAQAWFRLLLQRYIAK